MSVCTDTVFTGSYSIAAASAFFLANAICLLASSTLREMVLMSCSGTATLPGRNVRCEH